MTDQVRDIQYLFIVTYGRSGSTLLAGLLNSIPGYCIRGENNGVVYDLFNFHEKVTDARRRHSKEHRLGQQDPWYGIDEYPDTIAFDRMRTLVVDSLLRPDPDTRVAGFKEIRWWMPKPVEYLDFIEQVFPGAKFVFNTRNHQDVVKSSWHRKRPDALEDLQGVEARLRDTIARRGDNAYHVHYDDYVSEPAALKGLWDFLREPFDLEQIEAVMSKRYSSSSKWQ